MTLLAELFEQLDAAPESGGTRQTCTAVGAVQADADALAIHDHLPTSGLALATIPAVSPPDPAALRLAAARRNAWTITRGGRPICTVCGAPMPRDEALAEARWRWPDADILES